MIHNMVPLKLNPRLFKIHLKFLETYRFDVVIVRNKLYYFYINSLQLAFLVTILQITGLAFRLDRFLFFNRMSCLQTFSTNAHISMVS